MKKMFLGSIFMISFSLPALAKSVDQQMQEARELYAKDKWDQAIQAYDNISKTSDYWVEAVEEKAWAFLRKEQSNKVLSELKAIMNPYVRKQLGPEPYFLKAYTQLKVCDYPGVFETIKDFKTTFKPRISALTELEKTGSSKAWGLAVGKIIEGASTRADLGPAALELPRWIHKDKILISALKKKRISKVKARLQSLARDELIELNKMVTKLNLVETEVVQRMYLIEKPSDKHIVMSNKQEDEISFPVSDEVWADEVDKMQVYTRGCPDSKWSHL